MQRGAKLSLAPNEPTYNRMSFVQTSAPTPKHINQKLTEYRNICMQNNQLTKTLVELKDNSNELPRLHSHKICILLDSYLNEVYKEYIFSQALSNKIFFEETSIRYHVGC